MFVSKKLIIIYFQFGFTIDVGQSTGASGYIVSLVQMSLIFLFYWP